MRGLRPSLVEGAGGVRRTPQGYEHYPWEARAVPLGGGKQDLTGVLVEPAWGLSASAPLK